MPEASPAHLCNFHTAGGYNGNDDQRRLVPHAAGGMFVRLNSRNRGKIYHIPRMCHYISQNCCFLICHSAQINCHQQRRHLIIRHRTIHIAIYRKINLFTRQPAAVTFFCNNIIHSHVFSLLSKHQSPAQRAGLFSKITGSLYRTGYPQP